jgi:2-C-methyl-D-erythritol 4-phosphate cytidylyltransferase/2-C-methyl-D-erythritol 2,4-cyclodiphosphate synthase
VKTSVVLVAAGRGERLGLGIPKAEAKIAGFTLLEHALKSVAQFQPDQLVVVCPEGSEAAYHDAAKATGISDVLVTPGGATRQQSVSKGLALVTGDQVLIHDAARAFMPAEVFQLVSDALMGAECVIPVLKVSDTLKEVSGDQVTGTLDRSKIVKSQTPQGFRVSSLRLALEQATDDFTDEAALMEASGVVVNTVQGSELGLKVTTPADLQWAQLRFGNARTGVGTDAHRFSESGVLTLGCLSWPEHKALEGHSDGDSVAHAIVDSLLGAAGLGDIGSNFGVDRPEYSGAAGDVFLRGALGLIAQAGYQVTNVSVQIIADKPKVGPRRAELEQRLSSLVGAPVSVSATTTDGLGFLADAQGVAAVATALLRERS